MATSNDIRIEQLLLSDDVVREEPESPDVKRKEELLQTSILDVFDKVDVSALPPHIQEKIDIPTIKEKYKNATSLSVLLTGRTGSGKSTMVNGILGMNVGNEDAATEGECIKKPCTTKIEEYKKEANVEVTVWDTPGLLDGTSIKNQDNYLREMKKLCTHRDLTLYCIRVTETRFVHGKDNPDVSVMKKLTKTFGDDFWKNVVIVLTFANTLEALHVNWSELQPNNKAKEFRRVIEEWKEQVHEVLLHDAKVPKRIVSKIPVVPAGHYRFQDLPDRKYWLSALWIECLLAIPNPEGQAALIKTNQERLKTEQNVDGSDFKKQPEHQPIVITPELLEEHGHKFDASTLRLLRGVALGGVVGFVVLLPFFFISVPVGAAVGYSIAKSNEKKRPKQDTECVLV